MATGIAIPSYASKEFENREFLWDYIERTHKNRMARSVVAAMPVELSNEQNIKIAKVSILPDCFPLYA